jgi:hypothetical protein
VDGVWTDRSKGGGYTTATSERWEFAAWKNKVLAVNFNDNPQQAIIGGGNFSDLTTAVKARHIAAVRDFVVVANTFDATDGDVPARVRWCAFNNELDWTVSPSTLADFQDLKISKIERIFGGEYAVILQPDRTWRMSFTGAPTVWQFDEVLPGVGVIAPGAAAQDGDVIYFLSSKGFFALQSGTQATPIGIGRIDEFVRKDLDFVNAYRMSAVADPNSKRVYFAYPGADNTDGRPNRIVIYDRAQDRWSIVDQDTELVWAGSGTGGTGISLDAPATVGDPDLVDDPATETTFDDPRFAGHAPFVAAFDENYVAGSFSGDIRDAELVTKEYAFNDGGRTQLNGFRPLIQGGTFTARVGTRNSLSDDVIFGDVLTPRAEGRCTSRENARYHRFWLTVSGEWQHAIGIEIGTNDLRSGGSRG